MQSLPMPNCFAAFPLRFGRRLEKPKRHGLAVGVEAGHGPAQRQRGLIPAQPLCDDRCPEGQNRRTVDCHGACIAEGWHASAAPRLDPDQSVTVPRAGRQGRFVECSASLLSGLPGLSTRAKASVSTTTKEDAA